MTKKEKYALMAAIFLLVLYILWKKRGCRNCAASLLTSVSSNILDYNTGLPIIAGISNSPQTIGPVLLPPGISNRFDDIGFISTVKQPPLPLCPTGYHPVLDSETGSAYCVISSYIPSQTVTKFLN